MALKTYHTATGKSVEELLRTYGESAVKALGRQLYLEANGIMTQSKELCPVATGALHASGYVAQPERDGDVMRVELGYGGPATKINPKTGQPTDTYAIIVHEDLEAFHKVGMAHFLSIPFNAAKPGMSGRIVRGMRSDLASRSSVEPIVNPTGATTAQEAAELAQGTPKPGG